MAQYSSSSSLSGYQLSAAGAEMYEQYSALYMGQWAPGLVETASLRPGERVLDLACGTGLVARLAAARVGPEGRITGLDINAGMLAVARAVPVEPGEMIHWVEGSAVAMEFPDASFDVVICQQGLQFFPDRDAALREMQRVLVPGGRVALSIWKSASPYNDAVAAALKRFAGAEVADSYSAGRRQRVLEGNTLHHMMAAAGFRAVEVRPTTKIIRLPAIETFVLGHLAGHPVASAMAALREEHRAAFAQHVKSALCAYAVGDGVSYPDEANIVTGRR